MRDIREIVVNKDMVILGGNMRYKAMQEAGVKDTTVKIVDWLEEKQKEFIIKDNVESGEWDWEKLANEWDQDKLEEWGLKTYKPEQFDENADWSSIDDFDIADKSLKIVVQFETETDRENFLKTYDIKIRTKGKTTHSTWWPYKERKDFSNAKIQ